MSVPFEQAVEQLLSMFPTYDRGVLCELLTLNSHHIERTIETILAMEGQVELPSSTIAAQQPFCASTTHQPHQPNVGGYRSHDGGVGFGNQQQPDYGSDAYNSAFGGGSSTSSAAPSVSVPHMRAPQQSGQSSGNYSNNGKPAYRGTRCQLPSDFLRVPYSADPAVDETLLADEQLALMLQNELFQREAFNALGDDYMGPRPGQGVVGIGMGGSGSGSHSGSGSGDQSGDLGILRGLSSMGAAAKKRLSQLAQKYNNKSSAGSSVVDDDTVTYSGATTTSALHARRDIDGDTEMSSLLSQPSHSKSNTPSKANLYATTSANPLRSSAEDKGLLAQDDGDDDAEIIDFSAGSHSSHRGSHSLDSSNSNFTYRPK